MTIDIFSGGLRPMRYWTHRAKEKTALWKQGKPEGRSTGFQAINKYFRLVDAEFTLIAARPSMGKTSMGMQMAETVARNLRDENERGCVAVFSAEMSGESLTHRMAAALCGVDLHEMRQGRGKLSDITLLEETIDMLDELPIWIDDNSGPTTDQMLNELSLVNETIPIKMMLFDFIELGGDRARDENLRVSDIAKNLKGIAKHLRIPVVGLSQLSREVESRANKMPNLSDLRYSGMLEQIADNVLFIMRPEYYIERGQEMKVPDADKKGVAYVQIAKQRNGPVGLARMQFDATRTRFGDQRL